MARTTFSGPVASDNGFEGTVTGGVTGDVTGNVTGTIQLTSYTVAGVPSASANARRLIYVSNGAAGSPVVAFSNGTNWLRCDTLATISAT
jgi:hypothetical protein